MSMFIFGFYHVADNDFVYLLDTPRTSILGSEAA